MEYLTSSNLLTALLTVAGLSAALAAVWKGMEAFRALTGARERREEKDRLALAVAELRARVTACEERLQKGDLRFDSTRSDLTQTLTVLNALLMHFISGNDHEKLRDVKKELDDYLTGR